MKYKKGYLTFEEQADLLISRGLKCDRKELIQRLCSVNYYRLSGYLFPFKQGNKNWNIPFKIGNNRIFGILSIIRYMLDIIIPASRWNKRLETLLANFPEIPLKDMGNPENWKEHKVWKEEN